MKGRPKFEYTEQLANEICKAIATSEKGLHLLCKANDHWPHVDTVHQWILNNKEFSEKYTRAREEQANFLAEQILEIADNESGDVLRDKLRTDTRKWVAARLAPKKWGDKIEVDQNVSGSIVWKEERSYDKPKE